MVSESKILGKSSVIFVTVGTTPYPFTRLFKAIDQVISTIPEKPKLIVQTGITEYKWEYRNIEKYKYLSPPEMIQIIKMAKKFITHGGFGTMFMIAKYGQYMPLVIARQKRFREHVDDHQKYFIEYFRKTLPKKLQNNFTSERDLAIPLKTYLIKSSQNINFGTMFNKKRVNLLEKKLKQYLSRP